MKSGKLNKKMLKKILKKSSKNLKKRRITNKKRNKKRVRFVITKKENKILKKKIKSRKNKLIKLVKKNRNKSSFLLKKHELLNVTKPDEIKEHVGGGILSKLGFDTNIHMSNMTGMFKNAYRGYMGDHPVINGDPLVQNLKLKPFHHENVKIASVYQDVMDNI
jgi:hypothetical protein